MKRRRHSVKKKGGRKRLKERERMRKNIERKRVEEKMISLFVTANRPVKN